MKTLLRVFLMITVCTVAMSFTKESKMNATRFAKNEHKKMVQYIIYFTDSRGYQVELSSRGGLFSGNVQTFDSLNDGATTVYSGTCSGSYSINSSTNDMTISVTYTPSGGNTWSYQGPATYTTP